MLFWLAVSIQPAGAQQTESEPPAPPRSPPLHWAIKLGLRVEQVNRAFPVLDRVVLVPDPATYLDELSRWSAQGRWPVLFEDDRLAPMFIRRFRPDQVVRRESVGHPTPPPDERRQQMEAVIKRTWGGDPQPQTLREVFDQRSHTPPGVVITSGEDPAWTAAVALAAGRGQPIAWLDGRYGRPNGVLDLEALNRLRVRVDDLLAEVGYLHTALGDAIDTITLCREVAGRANVEPGQDKKGIRAITDLIGRTAGGRRFAFTGWIFGDEARCAYVAMCSLFLPRSRVWLYNTYSDTAGWLAYGISDASAALAARGYHASPDSGDRTTSRAWMSMLAGGTAADILLLNTKGNADFFDLSAGRAYAGDVPVLNEPLALHLIHSWSMRSPANPDTVGGRWLTRGVYALVGSVHEPGLRAFVPPRALAQRWVSYVPFLVSGRQWNQSPAWRINTFGDPLMLCPPPANEPPPRVWRPIEQGLDLRAHAKTLLRSEALSESGETVAEAIRTLVLLGADGIALEMWRLAEERGQQDPAAGPALGPLFRARRVDEFRRAWQALPHRERQTTDMLWHLMSPRLGMTTDEDTLLVLQSAIRPAQSHADLSRLAPHLTATFGLAHTRGVIQRELAKSPSPGIRKKLQRLLEAPG
jgi:hypothetical protein